MIYFTVFFTPASKLKLEPNKCIAMLCKHIRDMIHKMEWSKAQSQSVHY